MAFTEEEKLKRTVETERLLQRAQAGDQFAAGELLESYRPVVLNYLRPRTRKIEDAEDLTQRILINAHRKISSYQRIAPFSAWLLGIAANECRDYYKRVLRKRDKEVPLNEPANLSLAEVQRKRESLCPYDSVDNAHFVEMLFNAMEAACTEAEQRVLKLAFTEATGEEASRILGINQATVRSHFLRGRGKLLVYLVKHDPEMFGGVAAIEDARRRLARVKDFRKAVTKLARDVRLPVAILILLLGGDR